MKIRRLKFFTLAFSFALTASAGETNLFPGQKISFDRDVRPIFEQKCFRCHSSLKPKSLFRLDLRSEALKGGRENTNDIVPGDSRQSFLIRYVSGADQDLQMPPPEIGKPLSTNQVAALSAWIDQGAVWGTNSAEPAWAVEFQPELSWTGVRGDNKKFRELEGVHEGFGGGAEHFSATEQITPDKTFSIEGHALMPENDFNLSLALEKNDFGFMRGGFEEWRKYYDDTGGFYPGFTPSSFSLNRDLHEDIGRAWIDFGLTLPDTPQLVFGYEYQFRQGAESTLTWGTVNQNSVSKNIFPDVENVDERTHIFKIDLTRDWDGWELQDHARVEVYRLEETRNDVAAYSAGPNPDVIQRQNQTVHYTQGLNTFRIEKQIADWWLASGGFLLSRYDGSSSFNQIAVDGSGAPAFGNYWRADGITLARDSRVLSLASLFSPFKGLNFSAAAQAEWTHESGFGNVHLDSGDPAIPGLFFPLPGTVNANQDKTEYLENFSARFSRLPRTVLFAETRLRQQSIGQFDEADNGSTDAFQQRTDARNHFYDARAGFTSSPWPWLEVGGHLRRRDSDTGYDHLVDVSPFGGEGYPAFIRHRDITLNEIEGRLVLRPVFWLNARLTYNWNVTDFSTVTDPDGGGLFSPGGPIFDGRTEADTAGLSLTFTPMQQFYFSGAFTYTDSRTMTAADSDPAVVAYRGKLYTLSASAGFVLNEKTDLNFTYNFSKSGYGRNNSSGVPLGLDYTRHELLLGLTRRITKRLSGSLRYGFSQYLEPGFGNVNNFTAHGLFATFTYQWP